MNGTVERLAAHMRSQGWRQLTSRELAHRAGSGGLPRWVWVHPQRPGMVVVLPADAAGLASRGLVWDAIRRVADVQNVQPSTVADLVGWTDLLAG